MIRCIVSAVLLTVLSISPVLHAQDQKLVPNPAISALLESIRAKYELPGLSAAIVSQGKVTAIGAVGVRKIGSPEKMTIHDRVHIGSCTKALTATMIARLVESGKLDWQITLAKALPDLKDSMHDDFRGVTLAQLLTHRAGLPANGDWWNLGKGSTTQQRRVLAKAILTEAPQYEPGTKYDYSNVGYAIAGLIAEQAAGKSWEELMQKGLFEPLGMKSAGFGPPGTKGKVDQPWGHSLDGGELVATQFDNAAALGPAGTVHLSLADWGKFVALHLKTKPAGKPLLKPETLAFLQQPPAAENYACGWIVADRPWAAGPALTHAGSNTMWFAVTWLAPQRDFAVLIATNTGVENAPQACDDAAAALIEQHLQSRQGK